MKILGIIPARYASTRLPGKVLKDLKGKSMIQRVYEQASTAKCLSRLIVATDDQKVYDHVKGIGAHVTMTSADHENGTTRCYEALKKEEEKYDYVVNIQGDEPFINSNQIDLLGSLLNGKTEIATLGKAAESVEELEKYGEVWITMNVNREALYFSRSIIPHIMSPSGKKESLNEWFGRYPFFKHVGMYAYRSDILAKIVSLPVSPLEKAERLEQLRWMENGFKVSVAETTEETFCVDTQEDYEKALQLIK